MECQLNETGEADCTILQEDISPVHAVFERLRAASNPSGKPEEPFFPELGPALSGSVFPVIAGVFSIIRFQWRSPVALASVSLPSLIIGADRWQNLREPGRLHSDIPG